MATSPVLREATPEDASRPEVQGFACGSDPWESKVAEYFSSGKAFERSEHRPPRSRTLLYEDPETRELVGFVNVVKRNIGFPSLHGDKIPCLLLTYLAIASKHQGQGHFKSMIREVARSAIDADLGALYLLVDSRNGRAISAYEKMGFRLFENVAPYIDESDGSENVRMVLPLQK